MTWSLKNSASHHVHFAKRMYCVWPVVCQWPDLLLMTSLLIYVLYFFWSLINYLLSEYTSIRVKLTMKSWSLLRKCFLNHCYYCFQQYQNDAIISQTWQTLLNVSLETHFEPYYYYWPVLFGFVLFNRVIFYQITVVNKADKKISSS